jgi:hypothetical protein
MTAAGRGRGRRAGLLNFAYLVRLPAAPSEKGTPGDCSPGGSPKQDSYLKVSLPLVAARSNWFRLTGAFLSTLTQPAGVREDRQRRAGA